MSMSAQQRTDRRLWWLLAAAAILSIGWLLLTFVLVGSTLEPAARSGVAELLGDRWLLISLTW
jgi:DNA polymerase III subunit epsilon